MLGDYIAVGTYTHKQALITPDSTKFKGASHFFDGRNGGSADPSGQGIGITIVLDVQQSHTGKSWKSTALLSAKSKVKDFYEQMRGIRLNFSQAGGPASFAFLAVSIGAKIQMGRNKKVMSRNGSVKEFSQKGLQTLM